MRVAVIAQRLPSDQTEFDPDTTHTMLGLDGRQLVNCTTMCDENLPVLRREIPILIHY